MCSYQIRGSWAHISLPPKQHLILNMHTTVNKRGICGIGSNVSAGLTGVPNRQTYREIMATSRHL